MIYTSGTTGKPKGALRRNAADPQQMGAMLQFIGYTPDDVYLTTGPLYHSGPGGFMGVAMVLGQTVVLQRKFDPEDWLRLLQTYRCTSTFAAPTPIRMICNLPAEVKARYDTSTMRIMIANAAPWSFALKQQYVADFPPESLFEVYGSTELGVNTILRPEDQLRKPGSCGKEAPMVEVRLYDDDGNVVEGTGPDATGELFVRSPSVFADYYKQHDKFEEDSRDGFQTVGDIAYRDDEGFLYICDRKKDMIISGGMNIYPAEIEAALESHPDIYEAAVFGIPSEEWGETVHAVVVARPGADARRGDRHPPRPRAPRQLQGAALDLVARRAAEDRLGQDPQARAAGPVLGRPHVQGLTRDLPFRNSSRAVSVTAREQFGKRPRSGGEGGRRARGRRGCPRAGRRRSR